METSQARPEKVKLDFKDSKYATGKRKTSIAKVWLKKGSGKIYVNGKNYENYFKSANHKMQILRLVLHKKKKSKYRPDAKGEWVWIPEEEYEGRKYE